MRTNQFFILVILLLCSSFTFSQSSLQKIYPFALRGELSKVTQMLDTISAPSNQEKEFQKKFQSRFIESTEIFDYKTDDPSIVALVDMFHGYWKSVMIDNTPTEEADVIFKEKIAQFLYSKKYGTENISIDRLQQNPYQYINEFFKTKGVYSNAFGKTGHLYDLFLWKEETVFRYKVNLILDTVEVTVHLMDQFISTGWSHYTTFGRSYASGWANREALFCVMDAYDLDSEQYEVSYLTHEGQHFSDYKRYPKLLQKDLEYRAKLVELTKSQNTTLNLIHKFIDNSSSESNNAHAFANYCVIRDLSKALWEKDFVAEKSEWASIDLKLIKQESKRLFLKHSGKLNAIGADKVTEYIK